MTGTARQFAWSDAGALVGRFKRIDQPVGARGGRRLIESLDAEIDSDSIFDRLGSA